MGSIFKQEFFMYRLLILKKILLKDLYYRILYQLSLIAKKFAKRNIL